MYWQIEYDETLCGFPLLPPPTDPVASGLEEMMVEEREFAVSMLQNEQQAAMLDSDRIALYADLSRQVHQVDSFNSRYPPLDDSRSSRPSLRPPIHTQRYAPRVAEQAQMVDWSHNPQRSVSPGRDRTPDRSRIQTMMDPSMHDGELHHQLKRSLSPPRVKRAPQGPQKGWAPNGLFHSGDTDESVAHYLECLELNKTQEDLMREAEISRSRREATEALQAWEKGNIARDNPRFRPKSPYLRNYLSTGPLGENLDETLESLLKNRMQQRP